MVECRARRLAKARFHKTDQGQFEVTDLARQ